MNKLLPRAAGALACTLLVSACHARWNPLGSAPRYDHTHESPDGRWGKSEVSLSDDDNHYMGGLRYETPAAGNIVASAKPVTPGAQVSVSIYSEGSGNEAIAKGEPGKKVEATELQPGVYYIIASEPWKEAIKTRVAINAIFKPADPDLANGPYKAQTGARDLPADKGLVSDTVDYSAMRRTNFWKISLPGEGGLTVKFNPNGANVTAEFIPPQGAPEKIDPTVGVTKADIPSGDYFVKVTANDAGDQGKYELSTQFKAGDTCKNGGAFCSLEGAEDIKIPTDTKTSDVDFTKAKQFHYYKVTTKEKGKLTVAFKILNPPRGSKVGAFLMKSPDDDGDKVNPSGSFTKGIDPGDYYIKVWAPEAGDFAKYAISTIFQPDNFISAEVVEIQRNPVCMLTVSAGSNQGVRAGAGCTVVSAAGGAPIDSCSIAEVYPNLSKVKPLAPGCKIPPTSKIQVAAQ